MVVYRVGSQDSQMVLVVESSEGAGGGKPFRKEKLGTG